MTLERWMAIPNNIYVGRRGRIFIGSGEEKRIFHYQGSKYGNPYVVGTKPGQYALKDSLNLYKTYLAESGLVDEVEELRGMNLGCFCDQKGPCHAKVLLEYLE